MTSKRKITGFFFAGDGNNNKVAESESTIEQPKNLKTNPSIKTVQKWEKELNIKLKIVADKDDHVNKIFCEDCLQSLPDQMSYVKKEVLDDEEQEYIDTRYPNIGQSLEFEKEPFTCNWCSRSFTTKQGLGKHCKKAHHVENKHSGVSSKIYKCSLCSCSYAKKRSLKKHQIQTHNMSFPEENEFIKCVDCKKVFHTNFHLILHQLDKHDAKEPEMNEMGHPCQKCDRHFTDYRKFLEHQINIHYYNRPGKSQECEICKKSFASANSLSYHRNSIHLGKRQKRKRVVCDVCGHTFSRHSVLRQHISVKHSALPLRNKCEYCSNSYSRMHLLEYHVNKEHLGKKPYACDACDKGCYSSNALRQHMKICQMTEENMITCVQCHKMFKSKYNLTLHMQAVHEEPALVCPCGVVVKWMSSVARHKRLCKLNVTRLKDKPIRDTSVKEAVATLVAGDDERSLIRVVPQRSDNCKNAVEHIVEMDSNAVGKVQEIEDSSRVKVTSNNQADENSSIDPNTTDVADRV